jgi:hypothetical protein
VERSVERAQRIDARIGEVGIARDIEHTKAGAERYPLQKLIPTAGLGCVELTK